MRNVQQTDLEKICKIENEGFSKQEVATKQALMERMKMIPDTFIVAEQQGEVIGYVNGPIIPNPYITDDLFEQIETNPSKGGFQSVLGLVVSKQARNQGIARILMDRLEKLVRENERQGITLTCKQDLIPFYEKLGFANHGISESEHGGVCWYNMVKMNKEI